MRESGNASISNHEPMPGQAPTWNIELVFKEVAKIPGSFPALTPEGQILIFEQIISMKDNKIYSCDKYDPDQVSIFNTLSEISNHLLKYCIFSNKK